ncbi:GLPGLI family protein [Daejeonella sp.]|uniref:GLPGLI family protein n=1 Tax=Daejeonella sp. TaxID=2805397 RepID=UPI0039831A81
MKLVLVFLLFLLCKASIVSGQHARFTTQGSIEFEKSVNMHAQIKKMINKNNETFYLPAFEQYKKSQPQFKTMKSTLSFSKDKTLYTPVAAEVLSRTFFSELPAANQHSIIYTDLNTSTSTAQKNVYEELFLVTDSTRKINWKLTSETRDIAGYNCRRANALIMDSIYVVAFYTDEIPVSGGPESFTGLPGMILGVALPHENITWFAKIVNDKALPSGTIIAPKKGKVTTSAGLITTLTKALKNWGDYAQSQLKAYLL